MNHPLPPVPARPPVTHEVRPSRQQLVVCNLLPGSVLRVHHPAGPRHYEAAAPADHLIAVIAADPAAVGWGARCQRYARLGAIRNERHGDDRAVWEEAVRLVASGGVAAVELERKTRYGRPVWRAGAAHLLSVEELEER